MFSKIALFAALAALVVATPVPTDGGNCNTGDIQCCQQIHQTGSASHSLLAGILSLNIQQITADIGTQCSPLTVVGLGQGASWYASSKFLINRPLIDAFPLALSNPFAAATTTSVCSCT